MSAIRSAPYISIRDDAGLKTLSSIESAFIRNSALAGSRTDGRRWDQIRPQRLQLVRGDNTATATVLWGSRVTCTCAASLLPPHPDRPNEGILALSVDLSPAALSSFRHTNPAVTATAGMDLPAQRGGQIDEAQKLLTNRILRCLERILIAGGALDTEALCITPEFWVWKLELAVTVLDAAGGNILDASVLACMAALRHYRKPHVDQLPVDGGDLYAIPPAPQLISPDLKQPTPLPLHHTPLALSFALIAPEDTVRGSHTSTKESNVVALLDPNHREELVAAGSIVTLAMNVHGEICFLDYGGGCELKPVLLKRLHDVAASLLKNELCSALESTLTKADEHALQDRMRRLQVLQNPGEELKLKNILGIDELLDEHNLHGPFHHSVQRAEVLLHVDNQDDDGDAVRRAQLAAEELYRQQALDYNRGHVVQQIQEAENSEFLSKAKRGFLLETMLKSLSESCYNTDSNLEIRIGERLPVETANCANRDDIQSKTMEDIDEADNQRGQGKSILTIESDEEATIMVLHGEFKTIDVHPTVSTHSNRNEDENDIDDLADAVNIKKKKKTKGRRS